MIFASAKFLNAIQFLVILSTLIPLSCHQMLRGVAMSILNGIEDSRILWYCTFSTLCNCFYLIATSTLISVGSQNQGDRKAEKNKH